ncbi:citrate/2-methylcitrate synthase, partial [Phenylobacterium sp.]
MEAGLESVVAAHTVLSDVDGEAGRLVLRGAALEDLAGVADFETVCARLWSDLGPDLPSDLRAALGAARAKVWAEIAHLDDGLVALSPVEGLRALMARLADDEDMDAALRVTAAPAVFTGALLRRREGLTPLAP